jgi:hypothetical protein
MLAFSVGQSSATCFGKLGFTKENSAIYYCTEKTSALTSAFYSAGFLSSSNPSRTSCLPEILPELLVFLKSFPYFLSSPMPSILTSSSSSPLSACVPFKIYNEQCRGAYSEVF